MLAVRNSQDNHEYSSDSGQAHSSPAGKLTMGNVSRVLEWLGRDQTAALARIEQALQSLVARALADGYRELPNSPGFVMQWARGNFGHRIILEQRRQMVQLTPVAPGVPPFGDLESAGNVGSMAQWLPVGGAMVPGPLRRIGHVDLIEVIRQQGLSHPCLAWFGDRIEVLAEGRRLKPTDLQSMVQLGARKFLKTIPNTDRTHEKVRAVTLALVDLARREHVQRTTDTDITLFADARHGYASAMLEFLQETHPIEVRHAVQHHCRR